MLDRAKAAAPPDRHDLRIDHSFHKPVFVGVDRRRNDRHIFVIIPGVIRKKFIPRHHVCGKPTDLGDLAGKFQIAQVTVRRAFVRKEDRIIKIENHWDAGTFDPAFKPRRPKQSCLTKYIDKIKIRQRPQFPASSFHTADYAANLFDDLSSTVKNGPQFLSLERHVRDLNTAFTQDRLPLLYPEPLPRRCVVNGRYYS